MLSEIDRQDIIAALEYCKVQSETSCINMLDCGLEAQVVIIDELIQKLQLNIERR